MTLNHSRALHGLASLRHFLKMTEDQDAIDHFQSVQHEPAFVHISKSLCHSLVQRLDGLRVLDSLSIRSAGLVTGSGLSSLGDSIDYGE